MKSNNLNALRLIAAGLVLYGHSFVFLGLREPLFLSWLPLGVLGVFVFFTISGYLVSQSWERDPHWLRFFSRRALRIFPGLMVCVLLSILVLGPLLSSLSIKDYFSHAATWGYLENIFLFITYYLPGVFEKNRVANAVNGSLWSLPAEFFMYCIVAVAGLISSKRWISMLLFVFFALMSYFWAHRTQDMLVIYRTDVRQVFMCGTYFWAGAVFYKYRLDAYFNLTNTMAACILLLCLVPDIELLRTASWVFLPFVVLAFGFSNSPALTRLLGNSDLSYGIYIYAFPIQQAIVFLYPNIGLLSYLIVCFSLTSILAFLSWHLVESKALSFKPSASGKT